MFKDLTRKLKKLEKGMPIKVPLEADPDGYFDKECPSKDCLSIFKVYGEDWNNLIDEGSAYCPTCRHQASHESWYTTEQVEKAKKIAEAQLKKELGQALRSSARRFNKSQPRNSFISMTMQVKGRPERIPAPPAATDPLKIKITCDDCGCRYAVLGFGYFCPACGANSAEHTFAQSIKAILDHLSSLQTIKSSLEEDTAEQIEKAILEKGVESGVMAFQRVLDALYERIPDVEVPKRSPFQRLQDGSDLWENAIGTSYGSILSETELANLTIYFQRRHLFAHREGIVDEGYIGKSGDTRYEVGQRIVLKAEGISEFVRTLEKLVSGLKQVLSDRGITISSNEKVKQVVHSIDAEENESEDVSLDNIVQQKLDLSKIASELAIWLCTHSPDGLKDTVMFDRISSEFNEVNQAELEEVCCELELHGFVTCSATMGYPVRSINLDYNLFWEVDPVISDYVPHADALELAKLVLEDQQYWSSQVLHKMTKWEKRRFNPALAYMLLYIDDRRIRQVIQSDYVTAGFALLPEDRLSLKLFLKE